MNRAEMRRQQKLSKKASKNTKPVQSASPSPGQQTLTTQQAIDLALQHHNAGRFPEAENIYQKILQADPNQPVALHLLGVIAHQRGQNDVAVDLIAKALAIKPDYAGAHSNLGVVLKEQGKLDEAVASYHKALAIRPDYAEAHSNLGNALKDQGKLDEAVASCKRALEFDPDQAEAHSNLGYLFQDMGKPDAAIACHRRAIALNPRNGFFWAGFAASLETHSFTAVDDDLWRELLLLLEQPTVSPINVIRPILSALRHDLDFSHFLSLTGSGKPDTDIDYESIAGRLSMIPLFLLIMTLCPLHDLEVERMLIHLRRAMLRETKEGKTGEKDLPFSVALALQCFTNEYVFPETDEETASVEQLQQQIAALVEKQQLVPPAFVATLGAYRPLHGFPWARQLSEQAWTGSISQVVERQILEPEEEQSLRSAMPRLTPIENTVSQAVREQYEENPYPRWVKTGMRDKAWSIGTELQKPPLRLYLGDYDSPECPEILIAGCGTGQHSLITASRFANARVLAVDLSLSSLSYAWRQTKKLGISNIEYAQADILELGSLDRQFDLIESAGVLHHLGDPLAGWQVLVDLLRPGGLMNIGLYSETARQDIVSAREMIAEKGYGASAEDIRRCRQDIIAMAEGENRKMARICKFRDFYSLSGCRDLLFHIQEHRFTLPQIEVALEMFKLKFLGFEFRDQEVLNKFRKSHPDKSELSMLPLWRQFELDNPKTFKGMYQFWCKKK